MTGRNISFIIMLVLLLVSALTTHYLTVYGVSERVPDRKYLAEFPERIGIWRKIDAHALGSGQASELNADDYLSRTYVNDRGWIAYFFAAFYSSQRHRRTMHSPQNCIPGAGWSMSNHKVHKIRYGEVNEYLISKDDVEMLAFYWYQGRGRVTAGDYLGRFYTIRDALVMGRTDGAMVRVIFPLTGDDQADARMRKAGLEFIREIIPRLSPYIPE